MAIRALESRCLVQNGACACCELAREQSAKIDKAEALLRLDRNGLPSLLGIVFYFGYEKRGQKAI